MPVMKLNKAERLNNSCSLCGDHADIFLVRKIAANAFFCWKCVRKHI